MSITELGGIEEVMKEMTEMLGSGVSSGKIATGALVDSGGLGVKREAEVAFDRGDRSAHLVRGGRDKLGLLAFLGELFGDVTEGDDFRIAVFGRENGEGNRDALTGAGRNQANWCGVERATCLYGDGQEVFGVFKLATFDRFDFKKYGKIETEGIFGAATFGHSNSGGVNIFNKTGAVGNDHAIMDGG